MEKQFYDKAKLVAREIIVNKLIHPITLIVEHAIALRHDYIVLGSTTSCHVDLFSIFAIYSVEIIAHIWNRC